MFGDNTIIVIFSPRCFVLADRVMATPASSPIGCAVLSAAKVPKREISIGTECPIQNHSVGGVCSGEQYDELESARDGLSTDIRHRRAFVTETVAGGAVLPVAPPNRVPSGHRKSTRTVVSNPNFGRRCRSCCRTTAATKIRQWRKSVRNSSDMIRDFLGSPADKLQRHNHLQ